MYYHRPKMGAVFYALGIAGTFAAVLGFFVAVAMYFETQGVTKDDFKAAVVAVLWTGLGSFLMLGLASVLNVLHDIRTETSKLAAFQMRLNPPPQAAAPSEAVPFPDRARRI
jgi:cytochrome bd-type quinol oxidase subunit 1